MTMNNTTAEYAQAPSRTRSRVIFLAILAVFFGPMLVAYLMFVNLQWAPEHHTNHGELIEPVRPLTHLSLRDENAQVFGEDFWRHRWTLVYVGGGPCDLYCETALFKMRQARLSLGRDADRVQRLYLLSGAVGERLAGLLPAHKGMVLASPLDAASSEAQGVFGEPARGALYLVDPMGNLMLRYDEDSTTKGIQKDLKRLLKVSKIG